MTAHVLLYNLFWFKQCSALSLRSIEDEPDIELNVTVLESDPLVCVECCNAGDLCNSGGCGTERQYRVYSLALDLR